MQYPGSHNSYLHKKLRDYCKSVHIVLCDLFLDVFWSPSQICMTFPHVLNFSACLSGRLEYTNKKGLISRPEYQHRVSDNVRQKIDFAMKFTFGWSFSFEEYVKNVRQTGTKCSFKTTYWGYIGCWWTSTYLSFIFSMIK